MSVIQPEEQKVIELANYSVNTYINKDPIFSPKLCVEKSTSSQRTINACESFQS